MQDPDVLERVEAYLRNSASGTISFAPSVDLEEVADFLLTIRTDQAMVVYPCRTHVTALECERANFEDMLQFAKRRRMLAPGAENLIGNFLSEYMTANGSHRDCHS